MTASKRAQGGLSMIGFLFVAVVIVVVAMVGFRIAPSYVEYFTIRSAIEKSLRDAPDPRIPESGRFAPYCSGMALPPIMLPRTAEGLFIS